jgi:hypothetical protein
MSRAGSCNLQSIYRGTEISEARRLRTIECGVRCGVRYGVSPVAMSTSGAKESAHWVASAEMVELMARAVGNGYWRC